MKKYLDFINEINLNCVDCGGKTEAYFVKNNIWYDNVPKSKQKGSMCLKCLEKRLGRKLNKTDFLPSDVHKNLKYFKERVKTKHYTDIIIDSYFETALWTNNDNEEFIGKTISDISDEAKIQTREEIEWFISVAGDSIDKMSDTAIGHDIWLTRNHHGTGFWDRSFEDDDKEVLVELSNQLGESDIYVGDDGKIYSSGSEDYKMFDVEQWKEEMKLKKDKRKYNL